METEKTRAQLCGLKMKLIALAIGTFYLPVGIACPAGTVPQQGIGWQGCAPVPGSSGATTPTVSSAPIWADRWGAIAVDMTPGGVGIESVTGMTKKRLAESSVLAACRKKGGTKCKIEISYYNQCAALTLGADGFNSSSAASKEEAQKRGINTCEQAGDTNCKTYFSDCSLPERIR